MPTSSKRRPGNGGALAGRGGRIAAPMSLASCVAASTRHAGRQPADHRHAERPWDGTPADRELTRIEHDRRQEVAAIVERRRHHADHRQHARRRLRDAAGAKFDRSADDVRIAHRSGGCHVSKLSTTTSGWRSSSAAIVRPIMRARAEQIEQVARHGGAPQPGGAAAGSHQALTHADRGRGGVERLRRAIATRRTRGCSARAASSGIRRERARCSRRR